MSEGKSEEGDEEYEQKRHRVFNGSVFSSGEMGKSAQGAKGLKTACEGRKEWRKRRERSSRNGQEEVRKMESGSPELPAGNVSAQSLHCCGAQAQRISGKGRSDFYHICQFCSFCQWIWPAMVVPEPTWTSQTNAIWGVFSGFPGAKVRTPPGRHDWVHC